MISIVVAGFFYLFVSSFRKLVFKIFIRVREMNDLMRVDTRCECAIYCDFSSFEHATSLDLQTYICETIPPA